MARKIGRRLRATQLTHCWIQASIGKMARSSALSMAPSRRNGLGCGGGDAGQDVVGAERADELALLVDDGDRAAVTIVACDLEKLRARRHADVIGAGRAHLAAVAGAAERLRVERAEHLAVAVEHEAGAAGLADQRAALRLKDRLG